MLLTKGMAAHRALRVHFGQIGIDCQARRRVRIEPFELRVLLVSTRFASQHGTGQKPLGSKRNQPLRIQRPWMQRPKPRVLVFLTLDQWPAAATISSLSQTFRSDSSRQVERCCVVDAEVQRVAQDHRKSLAPVFHCVTAEEFSIGERAERTQRLMKVTDEFWAELSSQSLLGPAS